MTVLGEYDAVLRRNCIDSISIVDSISLTKDAHGMKMCQPYVVTIRPTVSGQWCSLTAISFTSNILQRGSVPTKLLFRKYFKIWLFSATFISHVFFLFSPPFFDTYFFWAIPIFLCSRLTFSICWKSRKIFLKRINRSKSKSNSREWDKSEWDLF